MMTLYHNASIVEVSALVREQKLSSAQLVRQCLERIDELNPTINAFITLLKEKALTAAELADREIQAGNWKGPLHGIPVAAKDFFDTAGIRTTAAFAPFQDRIPSRDAEAITRLKEAGAILVGKTNMHELGMGTTSVQSHFGSVHNPWSPSHIAGGSSGGSAAAVAAGMCFATVDTDAIGSCRLAAAICGTVGFKPTYGLISTRGILEGEEGADETIVKLSTNTSNTDSWMKRSTEHVPHVKVGLQCAPSYKRVDQTRFGIGADCESGLQTRRLVAGSQSIDQTRCRWVRACDIDRNNRFYNVGTNVNPCPRDLGTPTAITGRNRSLMKPYHEQQRGSATDIKVVLRRPAPMRFHAASGQLGSRPSGR